MTCERGIGNGHPSQKELTTFPYVFGTAQANIHCEKEKRFAQGSWTRSRKGDQVRLSPSKGPFVTGSPLDRTGQFPRYLPWTRFPLSEGTISDRDALHNRARMLAPFIKALARTDIEV